MGKTWKAILPAKQVTFNKPTVDFVSGSNGAEVLRVTGAQALRDNILLLPVAAREAAAREMAVIAAEVIEDAKENYVPVDTGDLRDSGDSDDYVPDSTEEVTIVAMWFGGEVTAEELAHGKKDVREYALEQHENMEYRHSVGGPKYLERPFVKIIDTVGPRIANAIAVALNLNSSFVSMALLSGDEPITSVDPNLGAKS